MRNTDEMQNELLSAPSLERFLSDQQEQFQCRGFADYLNELITTKEVSKTELAKNSYMSEVYLYQILSGVRHPSRNRVICLAFSLGATLPEVQRMMTEAGFAPLYVKDRRDAILLYGLSHSIKIEEINELLFHQSEEELY